MKRFNADLHIHSCLSPCGDLEMSPRAIVERSLDAGLNLIAVCDHNSAENVGAAMRAGLRKGLHVLPGIEICSKEEVHFLAIFGREEEALTMQEILYRDLRGSNRPELFGDQVVVNEEDEVERFNDRLLIGAVQVELNRLVDEVRKLGGLSIASHVDRPAFSILSQLGFVPEGLRLDALEVSRHQRVETEKERLPMLEGFPLVAFSDAHFLEGIGTLWSTFFLEAPTVGEIRMALKGEAGRRVS